MSVTSSVAGFRDFDDLTKGTPGYSHRLLNLYNTCTENKDTRHRISFEEAVSRLISGVKSTIRDIEIQGNTVKEFIIGKSFVKQRIGVRFRPDKPKTWILSNGINGRWRYYNSIDYSGLVALACVERDMIPDSMKQNIRFTFTDEDDDHYKKQEFVVDQQLYTLALEQRLIQHFMLIEPDERLRNHSLDCGIKSKGQYRGGIIYLAFKMGSTYEKDEKDQSNDSFKETARADTKRCEYLVAYEGKCRLVLIPFYRKDEAEEIFKEKLGIPYDMHIEISLEMKAYDTWAIVDIRDLPESGNLRVNVLSDVKDNIKVKPERRADSAEISRAYHVQGQSNSCTSRSPATTTNKEKGKKVTFHDTDRVLPSSGTGGVTPDKYMNIHDLTLGTKIRSPATTTNKEKGKKVTFHDTDRVLPSSGTGGVTPDKYMNIHDLTLGTKIRSPATTTNKEKGKKVTFHDTDRVLPSSGTGGVTPDKYMNIHDLTLGTKIRYHRSPASSVFLHWTL
ncbi:hypothetical protein FSP39_020632 [Pinctada imbricata]|uniref:Uncharacterized protein n=1 Tax=Pinctada imbricata TaxID=66713 RepID=A0AA88YP71_PINIB|nr:hypothetical protein FSP39_020632 [Pinctada imbricata]